MVVVSNKTALYCHLTRSSGHATETVLIEAPLPMQISVKAQKVRISSAIYALLELKLGKGKLVLQINKIYQRPPFTGGTAIN